MSQYASLQSTGKMTNRPHFARVRGGDWGGTMFFGSGTVTPETSRECDVTFVKGRPLANCYATIVARPRVQGGGGGGPSKWHCGPDPHLGYSTSAPGEHDFT